MVFGILRRLTGKSALLRRAESPATTQRSPVEDRLRGSIYGLLVGDAAGVPVEGKTSAQIAEIGGDIGGLQLRLRRRNRVDGQRMSHEDAPDWAWSDDGSQCITLLESLLRHPHFDFDHFGQALVDWRVTGRHWVNNHVFDVGALTQAAIGRLQRGVPPGAMRKKRRFNPIPSVPALRTRISPFALHAQDTTGRVKTVTHAAVPAYLGLRAGRNLIGRLEGAP